ncbi:hypothetical protein BS78_06G062800 [Paspalum vaginatum]|nr:hypothetical protein BS78_06G062800 [Paspalum vaginatum]
MMGQDAFYHISRVTLGVDPATPSSVAHTRSFALAEIDRLLRNSGHTLDHFHLPQPDTATMTMLQNRLLMDEQAYDPDVLSTEASDQLSKLNPNQKHIYDAILHSVNNNICQTFFVYGFGGTGKTFLWNSLLNSVRSEGKIALAVASSGIASLWLPGGRTPHSRFRIPLDIHEHSLYCIKKNTHLAELVQETSLIIWDEAPVNHKHCFEALDRTLKDIMASKDSSLSTKQFGGITVALGEAFRQTLPVLPNARKQEILSASIRRSHLW